MLKGFLSAAGLPPHILPSETSTLDAMRAALVSLYGGRNGKRVESLKGSHRGYGVLAIREGYRDIGGDNTLTCELYATRTTESIDIRFYESVTDETAERRRIYAQIDSERGMVDNTKVSDMIADIMGTLNGIRLRERGGVWWIPAGRIDQLRTIRALLSQAVPGVDIGIMTVHVDDDSVRAAISSIRAEAAAVTKEIQDKLVGCNGVVDSRAMTGMRSRLESLSARLSEYETSLGQALPDITAAVAQCQTACLLATMGQFDSAGFRF